MQQSFFEAPGEIVSSSQLQLPKAKGLALALETGSVEYAHLVECRKTSKNEEVVLFDVDVEVPQHKVHQIHPRERIAVTFGVTDRVMPKTEALRRDFPQVPHLNLHRQEFPRDLCLYAERYEEIRRRWTAARFVKRVREWLASTAKGELHQPDQPLEPVLLDYIGHIVIPSDLRSPNQTPERLYVIEPRFAVADEDKPFLLAQREIPSENARPFVVSVHRCSPHMHGIINRYPDSLKQLADLVMPTGLSLLEELRERLKKWHYESPSIQASKLLIVILFPRTRNDGGSTERIDAWTFWPLEKNIAIIGSKLGIWQVQDGRLGLLIQPDLSKRGGDIELAVLNTSYEPTVAMTAALNGQRDRQDLRLAAVGLGALGSQVVINLARSGFGSWTLIDDDILMPHNLARHALYRPFVGSPKADGVALVANSIIANSGLFSALKADVLNPGKQEESLAESLQKADVILDMSASIPVARKLACDMKVAARRISLFLAPSGDDLVLLAEDGERVATLDAIEMQYYRAVHSDGRFLKHLKTRDSQQRYGQSCRDITSILPQNLVALHAAVGAAALQEIIDQNKASIAIWRCDPVRNVLRIDVAPRPVKRQTIGDWTVITDEGLLEKLHALRKSRLPKETGGVLLGSFDTERHLIYIADSLLSPPDSKEERTQYVRGCRGLQEAVAQADQCTLGMLEYIGEWHSHPQRANTIPSKYDLQLFAWLTELMGRDGFPAVMMIIGDASRHSCFVGEIERKENCLPQEAPLG
jgi:integrative and conjugative element protein (TIGR02256 family)